MKLGSSKSFEKREKKSSSIFSNVENFISLFKNCEKKDIRVMS
jgi:hypothetical protein